MAWRFVRQPNGRLARFSDIVDNFTHIHLTATDALKIAYEDMGREAAKEKVKAGVEDHEPWKRGVKGDGQSRMRDCLEAIERVHGKKELARVKKELGL